MKTTLLALGAVLCVLTQAAAVAGEAARGSALRVASIQQQTNLSAPSWSEAQQCLLLAQRLVARSAPQRSANVPQDELKAISDEICAE